MGVLKEDFYAEEGAVLCLEAVIGWSTATAYCDTASKIHRGNFALNRMLSAASFFTLGRYIN